MQSAVIICARIFLAHQHLHGCTFGCTTHMHWRETDTIRGPCENSATRVVPAPHALVIGTLRTTLLLWEETRGFQIESSRHVAD